MQFTYKALKKDKIVKKSIDASSETEVADYLKRNGYIPIRIERSEPLFPAMKAITNRIGFGDIVNFTRQIAIMLNAGLTLIDCLSILRQQETKAGLITIIEDINKEVMGGNTFSSALRKYPHHFSNLYIALVRSGEASGKLSEILLKLADDLEKQREFNSKVKNALTYPVLVIIVMAVVVFIMVTFIIPQLLGLYKDFNIDLPLTTQILIAISDFSSRFWPLIILITVGGVVFSRNYLHTTKGKYLFDSLVLRIPVISSVIRMSALVDTTRTLSVLIGSGISMLEGLAIIIDTTSNVIYQQSLKNVYRQVEKGISLGNAFKNEGIFPPILVQMTMVGEQTGHLDDTLMRIARYFELESEMTIKTLTTLIEPFILVVLGVGVGFVVMSVITPIYSLTNSLK